MFLDFGAGMHRFAHDCTVFARYCAVLARGEFSLRRSCGLVPDFFVGLECIQNFGYMSLWVLLTQVLYDTNFANFALCLSRFAFRQFV